MPPASRPLILVGALQGVGLWWLWQAAKYELWPHGSPLILGALLWAALAVPAAIYLSENTGLTRIRRLKLVLCVGVAYLLFGTYAGWLGEPLQAMERHRALFGRYGSFAHALAASVLGFVVLPLVAGRQSGRWDYPHLFQQAWRNALLVASVVAVTGLFWAVLYSGAMLMNSIGLGFIRELIEEPIFVFPVTGIVVGALFAQGHARAERLIHLRHYWLALNAWLLPLLLFFGVMWLAALPFTGLAKLFDTRSAAFILLWYAALAVHFINCAWQDGEQAPSYPRWLAALIRYAWITLPVVAGVAGWALWLRIRQYGWTEDRVWAVFVWLLVAGHALGYAISLAPALQRKWLPRSNASAWMGSLAGTNILMAVIMLVGLALLSSPLADPRRLAVNDQVARLQSGRTAPVDFDYGYLRWGSDRWGWLALQALSQASGDARIDDIAARARQTLAKSDRWGNTQGKKMVAVLTHAQARQRIQQLKAVDGTDPIPDSFIDYLREFSSGGCLDPQRRCAIWMQDFNDDGKQEALLIVSYAGVNEIKPDATLWAEQKNKQWVSVASLVGTLTLEQWSAAIAHNTAKPVQPEWKDIEVAGKRLRQVRQDP